MAFRGILGDGILGSTFALGFVEDADPFNQTVNQSLGWNAVATYDPVINVFVSQAIFTQTVEALYREASNTIFTTSIASPDAEVTVVQYLGWTDRHFQDCGNVIFGDPTDSVVTIAVIATAANFWFTNPNDQNKVEQAHIATNNLGWTEVLSALAEANATNDLGFSESINFAGSTFIHNVNQDGGGFLRQTVSVQVDDNTCRELEYDPIVGSSDDTTYVEFTTAKPTFATGAVQFTYPPVSPTNTLTLDDPDFGNTDTLNFTRIDRETRGGDRKIYADSKWATWERLEMTISGLCEIDADDIIAFLNVSLGKQVRLTDWEGRTWDGFIVESETDIVNRQDGWRLDIVFEAELV